MNKGPYTNVLLTKINNQLFSILADFIDKKNYIDFF